MDGRRTDLCSTRRAVFGPTNARFTPASADLMPKTDTALRNEHLGVTTHDFDLDYGLA